MPSVLFVDDEPRILQGLQQGMRRYRSEWEMEFIPDPLVAKARLEERSFDVVVSDMRMPKLDGASLLQFVKTTRPTAVRIILTGFAELEATMRAVPLAHQFLAKPCESATVASAIRRSLALREVVNRDEVRAAVGSLSALPPVPAVFSELTKILANDNTAVPQVAALIRKDMAISLKMLQIVNSSYFRTARTIETIDMAVAHLGFTAVRNIVLAAEMFAPSSKVKLPPTLLTSLQKRALMVAGLAKRMATDRATGEIAYTAALVSDVGELVFAMQDATYVERALSNRSAGPEAQMEIERSILGVTHAEVGAYLLTLWGLPDPVIEAVAYHHAPAVVEQSGVDVLSLVHVAHVLIDELSGEIDVNAVERMTSDYLEPLGVSAKIPEWRLLARESFSAGGEE